jgi:uncharacterized Tic20 family protein
MSDPFETPTSSPTSTEGSAISNDDRTMGMLCHLLGIFTGFVGPLILWLIKKDQSAYIDHQGKEAVNFQISVMLYMIAAFILAFILVFVIGPLSFPLLFLLVLAFLILEILAAVAAQKGELHRYPLCIRFIR